MVKLAFGVGDFALLKVSLAFLYQSEGREEPPNL